MKTLGRLVVVSVAFFGSMAATAAEPASATPVAAPATAAQPAAPVAPAAQAASTKPAAEQADKVPAGYKSRVIDGETVYCRKETPMGTRFPTEVCMTVAQYQDTVRNRDALRQELTGKQKSYSINN